MTDLQLSTATISALTSEPRPHRHNLSPKRTQRSARLAAKGACFSALAAQTLSSTSDILLISVTSLPSRTSAAYKVDPSSAEASSSAAAKTLRPHDHYSNQNELHC